MNFVWLKLGFFQFPWTNICLGLIKKTALKYFLCLISHYSFRIMQYILSYNRTATVLFIVRRFLLFFPLYPGGKTEKNVPLRGQNLVINSLSLFWISVTLYRTKKVILGVVYWTKVFQWVMKESKFTNLQNFSTNVRLILYDCVWLCQKLLFCKFFAKLPPLSYKGSYMSKETFWGIV